MPTLTSSLDTTGETYRANRAAQLALLDQLREQLELAIAGGGPRYQQRHAERGKLLARERIELLVDPDSPFLELSTLAAYGTQFTVGAAQWIASGFVAMIIATVIAIVTTAVRQLRSRRDPRYSAAQVRAGRSRHGPAGATRRAAPARPQQRGAELDVGAAATTAFLERHGEGRND